MASDRGDGGGGARGDAPACACRVASEPWKDDDGAGIGTRGPGASQSVACNRVLGSQTVDFVRTSLILCSLLSLYVTHTTMPPRFSLGAGANFAVPDVSALFGIFLERRRESRRGARRALERV